MRRVPPRASALALAALLLLCGISASCAPSRGKGAAAERSELFLGTVCSIRIFDGASDAALDAAFARLAEIDARMSANRAGTDVAMINESAGLAPVRVHDDVLFVVEKALSYYGLSGGAFDPTIGPVVKLWNIGMDGERIPAVAEIQSALPLVGASGVVVDRSAKTVFLPRKGMLIDLGAIAKGYAADEVGSILKAKGVRAAVVDLGGNILVLGKKPDGSAWRVGVQNPADARGSYIGIANLPGGTTVVTSGVYERYFVGGDGVRYHHILDTRTGYPVRNGLVSVTVISSSSVDADGLSTTLFALGLEKGMALVERLAHVEAIFIDEENRVYVSSGVPAMFALSDPAFVLTPMPRSTP